jgi:hypothetical protein
VLDEADIQDLRDGLADVATFAARLPRRRRRAARLPPLDPGIRAGLRHRLILCRTYRAVIAMLRRQHNRNPLAGEHVARLQRSYDGIRLLYAKSRKGRIIQHAGEDAAGACLLVKGA